MSKLYLKSNVVVEPLCWNWYAWAHLISPMTACMNIAYRHVKIMEKFIKSPGSYKKVTNQKFESGPIIQLEQSELLFIQKLLEETKSKCKDLCDLAYSIQLIRQTLYQYADGGSLENLYPKIQESLKGLIELVYDIGNFPMIKYIEPLFYLDYYHDTCQSLYLYTIDSDWRPFILGTPRLESKQAILINVPFSTKDLDLFYRSQFSGIELEELESVFNIPSNKKEKFLSFFDCYQKNIIDANYTQSKLRVRYFGHATVLLQTKNTSVLIDPLISYKYESSINRFTFDDLPDQIDYLLISHSHQDHFSIENLLKIRFKVKNVVVPINRKGNMADPSLKLILQKLGYTNIIEVDDMDTIQINDGFIQALPFVGEHAELDINTKSTFLVNISGKSFYFAVDLNNFDNSIYKRIFRNSMPVDVLFIGMECDGGPLEWLYGPLLKQTDSSDNMKMFNTPRTLSGSNCDKAYELTKTIGCKEAYVYSMGQEPWLNYIMNINYTKDSIQIIESDRFVDLCTKNNILSERLFGKKEWIY